jgi:hypothetical protein
MNMDIISKLVLVFIVVLWLLAGYIQLIQFFVRRLTRTLDQCIDQPSRELEAECRRYERIIKILTFGMLRYGE